MKYFNIARAGVKKAESQLIQPFFIDDTFIHVYHTVTVTQYNHHVQIIFMSTISVEFQQT